MIYIFLLTAILIESSISTLPLTLIFLILYFIFSKKTSVFYIAFVCGILLDIALIRPTGLSSIYFISVLGLILLYSGKFETKNFYFVSVFSFLASMGYLFLFSKQYEILGAIISLFILVSIYAVLILFQSVMAKNKPSLPAGR